MRPGSIVRFRNRDWVLLPSIDPFIIRLRPLTGTPEDEVAVHRHLSNLLGYDLPAERISPTQFPLPTPGSVADAQSLHLLWQAARLLLREGATPLRSFGRISVRPRPYQLVPLMLALRLDPVRLLIADDVGVGKTIEAALIARELWERGEVRRMAVLCPPYLCDQWQKELEKKFHLEAVVVGSGTVAQLERRLPPGRTVYEHYPVQVISIDFVKHERNRHQFLLDPPELVMVDEAHGVTPGRAEDRHLRYELVRELAQNSGRHLILLTATPHSGIEDAFHRLLGLLDRSFEQWDLANLDDSRRAVLARHLVQRTRKDILVQWEGGVSFFPEREAVNATYVLSAPYRELFEKVYDFCTEIVQSGQSLAQHRRRMRWWSALALLRCVMSSPRSAAVALERRRKGQGSSPEGDAEDYAYAYEPSDRNPGDEAPTPLLDRMEVELSDPERRRLRQLELLAQQVTPDQDNKLSGCIRVVRELLRDGFNPVVWCFYVDTAEYVAEQLSRELQGAFLDLSVLCLTGRVAEEERRAKVEELMAASRRVLVATDCLSEGVNLQEGFNAVVHYDLPWNPNRLEQREGRVDRYGQKNRKVRAVRYWGQDNPVDGAVLRVLLEKADRIRDALGTHVPVPENDPTVVEALVHALFFERRRPAGSQLPLELESPLIQELHRKWDLDARREQQSRTRFAQHALKPEDVARELEATDQVLGDPAEVQNFVLLACQKVGLPVRQDPRGQDVWLVLTEEQALSAVPEVVRRAVPQHRRTAWRITFASPTPPGAEYLGRNHPFVVALARYLFEQAFSDAAESAATRCGAIRTRQVKRLTALALLRPRYQLVQQDRPPLLAEEVLVTGWEAFTDRWLSPEEALSLLNAEPEGSMPLQEKREVVREALEDLKRHLEPQGGPGGLWAVVLRRARELEEAHRRIRRSVGSPIRGLKVEPHWPPDVLGVLVLQPGVGR
jgi:superfamily II DNA or RNA helicase